MRRFDPQICHSSKLWFELTSSPSPSLSLSLSACLGTLQGSRFLQEDETFCISSPGPAHNNQGYCENSNKDWHQDDINLSTTASCKNGASKASPERKLASIRLFVNLEIFKICCANHAKEVLETYTWRTTARK